MVVMVIVWLKIAPPPNTLTPSYHYTGELQLITIIAIISTFHMTILAISTSRLAEWTFSRQTANTDSEFKPL
jgi:hypothetical protein